MKLFEFFEKWNPVISSVGAIASSVGAIASSVGAIAIPYMLFNYQKAQDQAEDAEKAQAAVKAYLSQLTAVFLEGRLDGKKYLGSEEEERLRTVIKASTLATLKDHRLSQ
jgi:hypothetical protein